MRRIIYGYITFDDPDEGPSPWHTAVEDALIAGFPRIPLTLTLAGRVVPCELVLQENDSATWPETGDELDDPTVPIADDEDADPEELGLPFD